MADTPIDKTDVFRLLRHAYYDHLNGNKEFLRDLGELFRSVGPGIEFDRGPPRSGDSIFQEYINYFSQKTEGDPPPDELIAPFMEFSENWSLPSDAYHYSLDMKIPDLWWSYLLWSKEPETPPRLQVGATDESRYFRAPHRILIPPQAFNFDPRKMTEKAAKKKLDDLLKNAKEAGLEQIKEAVSQEETRGLIQRIPPRYNDPEERALLTGRLYQRVILKTTYAEIAKGPPTVTEGAVKKSVSRLRRLLGVPLPQDPGRPPKPKSK